MRKRNEICQRPVKAKKNIEKSLRDEERLERKVDDRRVHLIGGQAESGEGNKEDQNAINDKCHFN